MKKFNRHAGILALALTSSMVEAEVVVTTTKSAAASTPTVSAVDLAQTDYLSSSATGGNNVAANHANLFNGVIGDSSSGTGTDAATTMNSGNTFTIDFDISSNTQGYDITQVDSYFGWNPGANGRSNQGYEIILTFVGDSTATLVGPTHWEPNSPAEYWTTVSFVEADGGALFSDTVDLNGGGAVAGSSVTATGVKSITFNITQDAAAGGVVVAREIDIFGIPTGGVVSAFVNVGPDRTFDAAGLSTDKTSSFRIGGDSDDLAIVADLDGLSVVMGEGSTHVIDIEPQGVLAPGAYPLIDYDGTIGGLGFAGLQLGTVNAGGRPYVASLVDNVGDTRVDLSIISGGPEALTWTAATDSVWDLDFTENWKFTSGGALSNFLADDVVLFDDTAGSSTITVSGTIEPGSVEIDNSTSDYTFNGDPISGSASVSKQGTGSVTFNSANDFTGGLDIAAGSVVIGPGGAVGAGTIVNDGTIISQDPGTPTISAAISGSGGLIIESGTLTLSSTSSSYTGDTVIKAGTLRSGPGNGLFGWSQDSEIFLGDISGDADATLQFDQSSSTTFTNPSITVQSGNTGVASLHNSGNSTVQIPNIILGSDSSDGKDLTISALGPQAVWSFNIYGAIQDPVNMTPGTAGTVTIAGIANTRLHGDNTYSGNTVVTDGKLTVQNVGRLSFYPTTNGATNRLQGGAPNTGQVTMDGGIFLELVPTDFTPGNSWVLIGSAPGDFAALTYGESFVVESSVGSFSETSPGVWTLSETGNFWAFSESNGTLTVGAPPESDYDTWAVGFLPDDVSDPDEDFDNDGIDNEGEHAFGLDPTNGSSANPYVMLLDQSVGIFSYTRRTTSGLTYSYGYSTDLSSWMPLDPDSESTDGGSPVETITVTVPETLLNDNPKLFVQVTAE